LYPKITKNWLGLLFWLAIMATLRYFMSFPSLVHKLYTLRFFKWLTYTLRFIFNKFHFAVGEYVYLIIIIILIIRSLNHFIVNKASIIKRSFWVETLQKGIKGSIKLYIVFQLIWGLNYFGTDPAEQLGLAVQSNLNESQLDSLSVQLIADLNLSRASLSDTSVKKWQLDSLVKESIEAYDSAGQFNDAFEYPFPNIKKATFPAWGDYIGYTAFYQPITSEAIIRTDLPILTQPFTICHEIAHQLGYASETEANFIAFWIAQHSHKLTLKYSMELQIFSYVQNEQLMKVAATGNFTKWKAIVARNKQLLDPKVLADRHAIRAFFSAKQDQRIPGSEKAYDQFLQWNKQAKGLGSYDQVVNWVWAYYQKYPKTDSSTSYSR